MWFQLLSRHVDRGFRHQKVCLEAADGSVGFGVHGTQTRWKRILCAVASVVIRRSYWSSGWLHHSGNKSVWYLVFIRPGVSFWLDTPEVASSTGGFSIYIYLQYIDIQYLHYIHIQLDTVCITVKYSMYVQWIIHINIYIYIYLYIHISLYIYPHDTFKQHPNNPVKIQRWYAARHDNMNSICQSGRKNLRRNWEVWSLAAQMIF